jgi:signal transduction histidine kinase
MSFSSLIHPDDRHAYDRLLALQDSSQHSRELRLVKKTGEARWIDLTWGPVQFRDVSAFLSTAFDVTERKDAETRIRDQHRRLKELTSEITVMEERERRRMAIHLHDVIGQNLALGKMRIRLLEKQSSIKPEDLKEIREIIEEAIHQTRSLTLELSPPILYTLEFPAAVQSLAGLVFDKQGITVNVIHEGDTPHLDDDLRAILFSAIRELFVNIVKHAGASSVEVALRTFDATLRIVIYDNGLGEPKKPATGFGLFNIRERFEYFGGTIDLCSPPGKGTTFTLEVPLRHSTPSTPVTEKDHGDSHSARG